MPRKKSLLERSVDILKDIDKRYNLDKEDPQLHKKIQGLFNDIAEGEDESLPPFFDTDDLDMDDYYP